jgi:hypothetical protein
MAVQTEQIKLLSGLIEQKKGTDWKLLDLRGF